MPLRLLSTSFLHGPKVPLLSPSGFPFPDEAATLAGPHLRLLFPFSAAAAVQGPDPQPHFMVDYLVSRCGFLPTEAPKVSAQLSHLKSTQKPDAVLRFLHLLGFDPASTKALVAWCPSLLTADVDKTIKPKVDGLRNLGFSDSDIAKLISANPSVLHRASALPKIEFLRSYLPSKPDLLKALRRDPTLLHCSHANSIMPNISLLRDHGVPESRIAHAILTMPWLLTRKADHFQELFDCAVGQGFIHDSVMFLYALYAMSKISKETFRAKLEVMKSFGWSEADFYTAFRKSPSFLNHSERKLHEAMSFLLGEAGLEPRYVAEHPLLLMYSLEKRLVPRHRVHQILKSEGLPGARTSLLSIVQRPEDKFLKQYVAPHVEKVPALGEYHRNACAEGAPLF